MKKTAGIYFGSDKIYIVEALGRKVIKTVSLIPSQENVNLESVEVDEQIKVVALLQKTLRDNKIEAKEAVIGLALRDLIVRFLELPIMPKKEFVNALLFEVKRYLPFKIEELIFDFQTRLNKDKRRVEVLFVAAKKINIDRYLGIVKEAGLKVASVEPAMLSLLRLLSLQKSLDAKTSTAVVELDEDKGLCIIDRGFACFAHELKIVLDAKEPELEGEAVTLLKLANEVRVTLDYYRRQTVGKQIDNLLIVCDKDLPQGVLELEKELDLKIKSLKIQDIAGSIYISDIGLATAFGLSQKDQIQAYFKINLLSSKPSLLAAAEKKPAAIEPISQSQVISYIFIGVLIMLLAYFIKVPEQKQLKNNLNLAISKQPKISAKLNSMSLQELKTADSKYKETVLKLNELFRTRLYVTPRLDKLARILPQGMWLRELSIDNKGIRIQGCVYLGDDTKEIDLVNQFVSKLKKETKFLLNFKNVDFSTERATSGKYNLRNFTVECR